MPAHDAPRAPRMSATAYFMISHAIFSHFFHSIIALFLMLYKGLFKYYFNANIQFFLNMQKKLILNCAVSPTPFLRKEGGRGNGKPKGLVEWSTRPPQRPHHCAPCPPWPSPL